MNDMAGTFVANDMPIGIMFGTRSTHKTWTDRQTLLWADLAKKLTAHTIGEKDGPCILPAVMRGSSRKKADADTIDAVFLDSDTGVPLAELADALCRHGWAGVVASTHSHMTASTRAKRTHWDDFRRDHPNGEPSQFLIEQKQMLPHIAADAAIEKEDNEHVYFRHQPCPKFRVVLPLLRHWCADDYAAQAEANAAWKERIEAVAHALDLQHDQSCTDTSRLFYLPRYPADGAPPETIIIDGSPCDLFALPPAPAPKKVNGDGAKTIVGLLVAPVVEFVDPTTGEVFDLRVWAAEYGKRFRIADALRERKPDVLTGHLAEGVKEHIRCPNEAKHTNAGADGATFVVDAGASDNGGFVIHCRHAHCTGVDRLAFVRLMLDQEWLSVTDLTDPAFLVDDDESPPPPPPPPPPPKNYGPPTAAEFTAYLGGLTINDLAAMDGASCALIIKAKAELQGLTKTELSTLINRTRSAAKAKIKAEARDAKAKAEAEAKAAKAREEEEAKEKERLAKAREAKARLDAQKRAKPLTDDDGDPLQEWVPPDPATLPEITVAGGERPAIADAALAAMKAAGVPFYQRGKELARVCRIKLKQSDGKTIRVPAIAPVTKPMLLRAMGLSAKWLAFDKDLGLTRIDPPVDLGDHILGMIGEWPFPTLRGVIATPTMRFDGSLLTEPGYDPATGLVLFNPPIVTNIPKHPTKQDALEALAYLNNNLLTGFEFAEFADDDGNLSRAGALSMLMTSVLRGMMPTAPIHFITKPDAGSGGSYMQDLMSALAQGERCPTISLTLNNDEENEKRLSAVALSGQPIIAIDNFSGTLMGNFFCQLIERPMPQIRLLGRSEMVTVPNGYFVVANGINIAIGTDAIRRGVRISLDPNIENPEARRFTRDPVAEVLADRGPGIAAILTIARAYRLAGMPDRLTPRPSFEVWSNNVRSALVWLGWPDVDESIQAAREEDPHTNKLVALMGAWARELDVNIGYRVSELIQKAGEYLSGSDDRVRPDLWDALFDVAGNRHGQLEPGRLAPGCGTTRTGS